LKPSPKNGKTVGLLRNHSYPTLGVRKLKKIFLLYFG